MRKNYLTKSVSRALILSVALTCATPKAMAQNVQNVRPVDPAEIRMIQEKVKHEQLFHEAEMRAKTQSALNVADGKGQVQIASNLQKRILTRADDGASLLESTVTKTADGANSSKETYAYDSNGRHVGTYGYYWNGSQWQQNSKYDLAYDDNGKMTLETYSYVSDGKWVGSYKYEYSYDSKGNQTMRASYKWDSDKADWIGDGNKYEYSYDSKGNQTMRASYSWDSDNGKWVGSYKYEYSFDGNDNQTMYARYKWDSDNGKWKPSYKTESTYENGVEKSYLFYNPKDYDWGDPAKCEYEYDEKGSVVKHKYYRLSNGQWTFTNCNIYENEYNAKDQLIATVQKSEDGTEIYSKEEYEYDDNGNLTMKAYYTWDSSKKALKGSFKYEYAYDSDDRQTLYAYYEWDSTTASWIGKYYKYEHGYDSKGHEILFASYTWDSNNNRWKGSSKQEKEWYDENWYANRMNYSWDDATNNWIATYKGVGEFSTDSHTWTSYSWNGTEWEITSKKEYKNNASGNTSIVNYYEPDSNGSMVLKTVTTYYYAGEASAINSVESSVDDGTVRIYDLQGRQLKTLGEGINIVKANGKTVKVIKRR